MRPLSKVEIAIMVAGLRALQDEENLPCPARAGQDQVTKNLQGRLGF